MVERPDAQGAAYATLSAAAFALALVVSKQALQTLNAETFAVWWSFLAFVSASLYALRKPTLGILRALREHWVLPVCIGLLTAASVLAVSMTLKVAHPTSVSFLTRLEAVFTAVLGVVIFKERLTLLELLGTAMAMCGVAIMAFAAGEAPIVAFGLAISASLFVSVSTLLAKSALRDLEPAALIAASRLVACISAFAYAVLFATVGVPSAFDFIVTAVGVFWGPFLGFLLLYKALSLTAVFRVATLRTSYPLFVGLFSLIFFRTLPTLAEILGGVLILAGIALLIRGRHRR